MTHDLPALEAQIERDTERGVPAITLRNLARWWGHRHGYISRAGGHIYQTWPGGEIAEFPTCRSWLLFWAIHRTLILTDPPPRRGDMAWAHRLLCEHAQEG